MGFAGTQSIFMPTQPISMPAQLILFPSSLQTQPDKALFAPAWLEALGQVQGFVVESLRTSRRFLRGLDTAFPIDSYTWHPYDEATKAPDMRAVHVAWQAGQALGLLSDAGYPAVGDPGADVVAAAHRAGVPVRVLPGSCSFLMALAASGLGGQHFAFRGYAPIEAAERTKTIKAWENESMRSGQTQICMDTPYRNSTLWQALLGTLLPGTRLCLALDLQGLEERIVTKTVAEWRKSAPIIWPKAPAVFVFVG